MTHKKQDNTPKQDIDSMSIDVVKEDANSYANKNESSSEFVMPEGYVSGDEFERRVKEGLRRRLQENGYL